MVWDNSGLNSRLTWFMISTMNCLIFLSFFVIPGFVLSAPDISAPWGRIQGVDKTSKEGVPYYGYYGIPFAEPPVGELRFKKPVPHTGISGVFNASQYGPKCLQLMELLASMINNTDMDEDCLTLNVFLPDSIRVSSPKPVMVWIHGGGFVIGDPIQTEPWRLVTKGDVIVVTILYRLSVLGFLSTGSDVSLGNYGLWDQHLALKWVKTNIESFGGDKDNITIIGESAGAASVAYQILYPGSKGLFRRAILQSGAATSYWAINREPSKYAKFAADAVGCLESGSQLTEGVMGCLRSKDSRYLLMRSLVGGSMAYRLTAFTWVPVVDGDFVKMDPQIMMRNETFLKTTCIQDIDVMIGVNNNEGASLLVGAYYQDLVFNFTYTTDIFRQEEYDKDVLPLLVEMSLGKHNPKIKDVINVAYTYPRPPANTPLPQQAVFDSFGDAGFVAAGIMFAKTHASLAPDKKCYFYLFDHYPSYARNSIIKDMSHGEDLAYLFDLTPQAIITYLHTGTITQEEYDLSDTYVKFLAAFAKDGDPNSIIESKLGQPWPQFDLASQKYLSFTTNMSVGSDLYDKRISVWLDMVPSLEKIWKQEMIATTVMPPPPPTTYNPRWFYMDQSTAEITILALIIVLGAVVVILLITICCCCARNGKSPKDKYTLR